MKQILLEKVRAAIGKAHQQGLLSQSQAPAGLTVEVPKVAAHGDWSTNAALVLAKGEKKSPRDLTSIIIEALEDPEGYVSEITVAGPGFINFTLSSRWWHDMVARAVRLGPDFGRSEQGQGRRFQVEFVSANPTGPLHVGHGRGAAVGDALARILETSGYQVSREYYVNDAGRQMQTLGRAVLYRYLQGAGRPVEFAADLYQGAYIGDLAKELKALHGDKYLDMDEEAAVAEIHPWAAAKILAGIREDLNDFGVAYDRWFSETSLFTDGAVEETLADLKARGHLYEEGGALWMATSRFGDDKDRVLIKSSGEKTYFASDIAYHRNKYNRGFDQVINLWGADHHGYVLRMKSAVEALGYRQDQLEVLLVQLVSLLRGGVPVAMSTRAGEFVTLKEVVAEVGVDAARFFFMTRSSDSHLDFDLEVAKAQTSDNPVYYVQYAHARICSVFRKAEEAGMKLPAWDEADLNLLKEEEETSLMRQLAAFPELVAGAAASREPHRLTHYLTELAKRFHPYYNRHRFINEDLALSRARLVLAQAVKQVVANGLGLLGISAPEKM